MPRQYHGWTGTKANANLDALPQHIPGDGRTVATLSAYHDNNKTFNVKDYAPVGVVISTGVTDARASFAATDVVAVAAGAGVQVPYGTYRISSNITLVAPIIFAAGAKLSIDAGVTVTIIGAMTTAGRVRVFTGLGAVSFRNANAGGFSTANDTALPEWWGGFPGDGTITTPDSAPAFQAAVNAGVRHLSLGEGYYGLGGNVYAQESPTSPNGIVVRGASARTESYVLPLVANASVAGSPNAIFINKQDNGKWSFENIRFAQSPGGGTPAFTGYLLWALESGVGPNTSQAIFSGFIRNCWIDIGTTATGFFYGALQNYYIDNLVVELMKSVFVVAGTGFADVHFSNISLLNYQGQFLDMAQDANVKNIVSIRGLQCYQPQSGVLIKARNCESLHISDVRYQPSDPAAVPAGSLGLIDLEDCPRFQIANVKAARYPGHVANMGTVIALKNSSGMIGDAYVDGGDVQLALQGAIDLEVSDSTFLNALTFGVRFVAATTGRIRFKNSRIQYPGVSITQHQVGGSTHDYFFDDCDLLDAGFNNGVAQYGLSIETSGDARVNGGRLGKSDAAANMTASVRATGAGTCAVQNINHRGVIPLSDGGSTQLIKTSRNLNLADVFYGTAIPVAGTWKAGDRIINSAPAIGAPDSWTCTVGGTPGTWVADHAGGAFPCAAAATTVVNDARITATSRILITPTNAAAATLLQAATALYVSAKVAGASFSVTTANGAAAAGTETFDYVVVN